MKLADWRNEIDEIDAEIVRLLNRRSKAVREVGILKAKANLPIVDLEREREILLKACRLSDGELSDESLSGIFRKIIQESRELQIQTKTALLKQGIKK
jgi:chorismate mutase